MIAYHLLLARKHGQSEAYPLVVSFGDPAAVVSKYSEVTTPPALAEFMKEHAEIVLISDGVTLYQHDFPNPSDVERQRKQRALAEAREIAESHRQAKLGEDAAAKQVAAAKAALRQLTPEQVALLKADAEARAQADADRRAAEESARKAEQEAEAERQKAAAEAKRLADSKAARETFITELSAQTDDQLRALAAQNKAQVEPNAGRVELIEALTLAAGLEPAPAQS